MAMNKQRFSISLREYVDVRFAGQQEAVGAALAAAKEAVGKAEKSTDTRFELISDAIKELSVRLGTMIPRQESIHIHDATHEKVEDLEKRLIKVEEKGSGSHQNWQTILAVAGVIVPILSLLYLLTKAH
jgi:hypothetical protein